MAVYTDVPDEELAAFVAEYDLGAVTAFKGIAEGVENSNFLLRTERGSYILTLYEKRVRAGDLPFFHGQMGMFVRALAYMMSHGGDGLRQVAEDAVLNANYLMATLKDLLTPSFEGPCMHEALFDDRFLKDTGVTTLDFAKAMIDEGYHPMTMYFPLVVHGALLIEPTESESLASLDLFIMTLRDLAFSVQRGETERFTQAPRFAPRRRLDETAAARQPVLRWTKPAPISEAAE